MTNDPPDGGPATPAPRRKRRTTEEVTARILDAASREFELNGYTLAKTSAIARRAGVAEPLIFTNFGSKAAIFEKSIFGPLSEQLVAFCASHLATGHREGATFEADRQEYIHALQAFAKANSRKLASLLFSHLYGEDVSGVNDVGGLQDYFAQATALAAPNVRKPPAIDPALTARISFATILSCVLFREWLFPPEIGTEAEIDEAVMLQIVGGLRVNDPPTT